MFIIIIIIYLLGFCWGFKENARQFRAALVARAFVGARFGGSDKKMTAVFDKRPLGSALKVERKANVFSLVFW